MQLPGSKGYDALIVMINANHKTDAGVLREFQINLSHASCKKGVLNLGKQKNGQGKQSGQSGNIICRRMLMLRTNI